MSSRLLKRCGVALYGPRWQSDIARDLKVSDRTVRRWVDGSSNVPDGVYGDLLRLCGERAEELDRVISKLRQIRPGRCAEDLEFCLGTRRAPSI